MEYAIQSLLNQRDEVLEELKKGENTDINQKRIIEIKRAILWLQKLSELKIKDLKKYELVILPNMETGYSDYRIMNDCESDDRKNWIEWKDHPTIIPGDIIITEKP